MAKLLNPGKIEFSAQIQDAGDGGAYFEFPFDTQELFGTTGRVPVIAYFDGEPYRGSLVRMGLERHLLIILKSIREKIGKTIGDTVSVQVLLDEDPRVVQVPEDLQAALNESPDALIRFGKLSYSHQRQHILWIEEAKKSETRKKRIDKLISTLLA
jgi:hypothetical protein